MRRIEQSGGLAIAIMALSFVGVLAACDDEEPGEDGGRDAAVAVDAAIGDAGVDGRVPDDARVPGDAGRDAFIPGPPDAGPEPDAGFGGGAATSAQIRAVRESADGFIDLPIERAIVTYTKPAIGIDFAGFFLQAERSGPAIFVRIDPATLTPPAEVGQVVDLRATSLTTLQGRREITTIDPESWDVRSSGNDVRFLVQNVSSVDLVSMLDDFESELVTATFRPIGLLREAGPGFQRVTVSTAGLPASPAISFRMPDALAAATVFEAGCDYTVTATPLWRTPVEAQLSAFDASEISLAGCDQPVVLLATAIDERTVVVRFNRVIDPTTVMADGRQFSIVASTAMPIPVTGATALPGQTWIVVTTGADITEPTFYNITVATTVRDSIGARLDATMASDIFDGYRPHLVINEVDYRQPGETAAQFVEIHNPSNAAIPLAGIILFAVNGGEGTEVLTMVDIATNSAGLAALPPDSYLLVRTPSSGGLALPAGAVTVELGISLPETPAGLALMAPSACHDAVYYEHRPVAPMFMDCPWEASAGVDPGDRSLGRIPNAADSQENSLDFRRVAPTPGAPNVP